MAYDIKFLQQNKSSLREAGMPGQLTVDGKSLDVGVLARGAGSFLCEQPQLKIDFTNTVSQGSPFYGLKKVKLFTTGRCTQTTTNADQDKATLANYLIYKFAEQVFPYSFKTRLVEISYTDTSGNIQPYTQLAFFLEPEKQVERRLKLKRIEEPKLKELGVSKLTELADPESVSAVHSFEFFIGNFDYGIPGFYSPIASGIYPREKNIHVYRNAEGRFYPFVFDFDFSRLNYLPPGNCAVALSFMPTLYDPPACEVEELAKLYKKDLSKFKFKEEAERGFPALKQAFLKWRQENKAALDQLGPDYAKGLDLFLEAYERVVVP